MANVARTAPTKKLSTEPLFSSFYRNSSALLLRVTSYDGRVFFGITADRDLVPDADVFGQCLLEALDELLDTVNGGRHQAPRGRRKKSDP